LQANTGTAHTDSGLEGLGNYNTQSTSRQQTGSLCSFFDKSCEDTHVQCTTRCFKGGSVTRNRCVRWCSLTDQSEQRGDLARPII